MKKFFKIAAAAAMSVSMVAVGIAATTAVTNNSNSSSQGPDRTSYTVESLKKASLGTKPVFNSVTDNPYIAGSEFNFTGARLATATDGTQANSITVDANNEYLIRLYIHNNNANSTAEGLKAKVDLGGSGTEVTAMGYIDVNSSGSNYSGAISEYWDDIVFKSSGSFSFHLEYEEAHIETGVMNTALGEEIVNGGATIGYSALDGKMPGCYDKAAYVYVKVKVVPEYEIVKQVRIADDTDKTWKESVDAEVGDTVEYRLQFINRAGEDTGKVTLVDVLPPNVEYIKGSTALKNKVTGGEYVPIDQDTITTTGLGIGRYGTLSNAFLTFKGKVTDSSLVCNKTNELRNWAKATVTSVSDDKTATAVITDFADVDVYKNCEEPEPVKDCTTNPELPECVKEFSIDKMVQIYTTDDNENYTNSNTPLEVKAGDTLRYALKFKNTGEIDLTKVNLKDVLPENVEYVANSTVIKTESATIAAKEGLTSDGLTLHYADGSNLVVAADEEVTVTFKATVNQALSESCEDVTLNNTVYATASFTDSEGKYIEVGTKQDGAKVIVRRKICPVPKPEDCTTNPELPECVKEFSIDKMVQIYTTDDNENYTNSNTPLEVTAGDTLRYALKFKNTGEIDLTKVTLKDVLPENVEYVAGSTMIKNGSTYTSVKDGLTADGLTLYNADGSNLTVKVGEEVTVVFKATVNKSLLDSCEDVTLTNTVYATANFTDSEGKYVEVGTKQDGAMVVVRGKICPVPEPEPTPDPTPTPEPTPKTIVETGPAEIMTGALGAGSMVTALGCFVSSRKKLK